VPSGDEAAEADKGSCLECGELLERIEALEAKLDEIAAALNDALSRRRSRRRYNCEELLKKGACELEPSEKKVWVLCYARRMLSEGKVRSMGEGMKKGWAEVKSCAEGRD